MGISDLYMSIGLKRNISHFANIVRIACSDGVITEEEIAFLQKIAMKYNIEDDKFKEIIKNPDQFPTIGHLECLERIEQVFRQYLQAGQTLQLAGTNIQQRFCTATLNRAQ